MTGAPLSWQRTKCSRRYTFTGGSGTEVAAHRPFWTDFAAVPTWLEKAAPIGIGRTTSHAVSGTAPRTGIELDTVLAVLPAAARVGVEIHRAESRHREAGTSLGHRGRALAAVDRLGDADPVPVFRGRAGVAQRDPTGTTGAAKTAAILESLANTPAGTDDPRLEALAAMGAQVAFEVLEIAAAISRATAGELIILNAKSTAAISLAGAAGGLCTFAGDATFVAPAIVVAAATVILVTLGIDAAVAASGSLGAVTLPVDAGERIGTAIVATAAMLFVVIGIDTQPNAEDLVAGASHLALAIHTGAVLTAAVATASTMQGVVLGIDAGLAALGGSLLALFAFFLVPLLPFLLCLYLRGEACAGAQAERDQETTDVAAAQRLTEPEGQSIEPGCIHAKLLRYRVLPFAAEASRTGRVGWLPNSAGGETDGLVNDSPWAAMVSTFASGAKTDRPPESHSRDLRVSAH
jgi:hypothetical protein